MNSTRSIEKKSDSALREELRALIAERAVERRESGFKLASGRTSTLYIDLRRITQDPAGINLIGKLVLEKIRELAPDSRFVGGLETGSIPISTAVCLLSRSDSENGIQAFWVRKTVKDHGMQNRIEGNLVRGGKAVVVDDTITTGGSSLQAVEAIKEFGAEVLLAIGVVDRGAAKNFEKACVPYASIFSERDFK
jgi:orotate phosphoribosyltransferase